MGAGFSVVIPLYNNKDYIVRAIESALFQTIDPHEVIVVDDGSTDGGGDLVEQLNFEKVCLIRKLNGGVGSARNAGAKKAKGDWVAFLDADDAWMPWHLEELSKTHECCPDVALLSSKYIEISTIQSLPNIPRQQNQNRKEIDYFNEAARCPGYIWTSSTAVRRDVLMEVGGFGASRRGEDIELWAKIALRWRIAVSDQISSVYYRGTGGVMESRDGLAEDAAVSSSADLQPVLRMLLAEIIDDDSLLQRKNIRNFFNGWICLGIKSNLIHGNYNRAKSLGDFLIPSRSLKVLIYRLVSGLPVIIISWVVLAIRSAKRCRIF